MKKYSTEALVLKNINYKDAHKIYTLLTKEHGKISAVARGVRKISSRRAGNLDTLNRVSISLDEGKEGHKSIVEVKTLSSYPKIKSNVGLMQHGFYIAELINSFIEEGAEVKKIYQLAVSALETIEKFPNHAGLVVNAFEVNFLDALGLMFALDKCVKCQKRDVPSNNSELSWEYAGFSVNPEGLLCPDCSGKAKRLEKIDLIVLKLLSDLKVGTAVKVGDTEGFKRVAEILKTHLKTLVTTYGRKKGLKSLVL